MKIYTPLCKASPKPMVKMKKALKLEGQTRQLLEIHYTRQLLEIHTNLVATKSTRGQVLLKREKLDARQFQVIIS